MTCAVCRFYDVCLWHSQDICEETRRLFMEKIDENLD